MSVDLVGSTAFKSMNVDKVDAGSLHTAWLDQTIGFYRNFPRMLADHCLSEQQVIPIVRELKLSVPKVWKTVGDEIIFCVKIECLEHLAICHNAFVKALEQYGRYLNSTQPILDVKGCAWVAVFPTPNVTILSAGRSLKKQNDGADSWEAEEDQETSADDVPSDFDFLGRGMDAGFRVAKFASASELALSAELAWLLTIARHQRLVAGDFIYHGSEALKGVAKSQPYPVVTVDTEREPRRRKLVELERSVGNRLPANPTLLCDFLHCFLTNNNLDVPVVALHGDLSRAEPPPMYTEFAVAWGQRQTENTKRDLSIENSANADNNAPIDAKLLQQSYDDLLAAFGQMMKKSRSRS